MQNYMKVYYFLHFSFGLILHAKLSETDDFFLVFGPNSRLNDMEWVAYAIHMKDANFLPE